ncbi:MAG: sugar ABC transporter permease [Synergistales bacterium]|nr:sugar ABC transporter permease [Synergistales bacterium]
MTLSQVIAPLRGGWSGERRREAWQGYLCISPWLIGFLAFALGPMIASLYYSLTEYRIIRQPTFVGLSNYKLAFTGDPLFYESLARTGLWTVATVPAGIIGSLIAAVLLHQGLKGTSIYRTMYFLPSLTPTVAASLLWRWMLHPEAGVVNWFLSLLGIEGPGWLSSPKWAIWALAMISLWTGIGGGRMVIFLAGLQGIPEELYEAAEIDGAGTIQKTWRITVPLMTPTIFFNLIMGILGSFRSFDMAFLTTQGGPAYATYFFALHIYYNAFQYYEMGYACMLSWILFILIIILTVLQFGTSKRWVFYGAER